jgi:hypothetical protein
MLSLTLQLLFEISDNDLVNCAHDLRIRGM